MNLDEFWSLPGPRRFVSTMVSDVLDGKCVVAKAPQLLLNDIVAELRRRLREREHRIDTIESNGDPLLSLLSVFPAQEDSKTLETLVSACGQTRRALLVSVVNAETWDAWTTFLLKFHHRIRQLDAHARPTLVVVTNCPMRSLIHDVALRVRGWEGAWTEADSLALAQFCSRVSGSEPLLDKVLVHTIAALALWDADVCEILAGSPMEMLGDPLRLLLAVANQRQWTANTPETVDLGTIGYLDGRPVVHSALLAAKINHTPQGRQAHAELSRRQWRAQATVLLPWIEEQRLRLVRDFSRFLPIDADDPPEIREIGAIWFGLRRSNAPALQKRRADLLRDARNTLAHRSILSLGQIRTLETVFT